MPVIIPSEIDSKGYNSRADANKGHEAMCAKWERKHARKSRDPFPTVGGKKEKP
jgi:hypothetical protein